MCTGSAPCGRAPVCTVFSLFLPSRPSRLLLLLTASCISTRETSEEPPGALRASGRPKQSTSAPFYDSFGRPRRWRVSTSRILNVSGLCLGDMRETFRGEQKTFCRVFWAAIFFVAREGKRGEKGGAAISQVLSEQLKSSNRRDR